MKELMPFAKFKAIMEVIENERDKRDRISDFLEKELCEDSWCCVTFGNDLEQALINLLADEFECWYSTKEIPETYDWWDPNKRYRGFENDIENYLYRVDDNPYNIKVGEKEYHLQSIDDLYNFLVDEYKRLHSEENLTVC